MQKLFDRLKYSRSMGDNFSYTKMEILYSNSHLMFHYWIERNVEFIVYVCDEEAQQ